MADSSVGSVIQAGGKKIVLAGNPNVGKSVIFNALTGLYEDVSNYSGTTLDMACGRYGDDVIIDTPGVYGLSALNKEEEIARDIILSADVLVNVVNAVHLGQNLFFTLQLIDMGLPVVVVLNMMDEAEREGLKIDVSLLGKLLGVPIVTSVAIHDTGIDELKKMIYHARPGNISPLLLERIEGTGLATGRDEALLVLEGDPEICRRCGVKPGTEREDIYRSRREQADQIAECVIKETKVSESFASRLGRWMILPITGFPLLALALWAIYELVGVFLAQNIVDFTENFMKGYYEPAIQGLVGGLFSSGSVINSLLVGHYGLLTLAITYMFGLLLPLVLGIFFVLSILEDTGYLPRIAALVDRALVGIGLNGQAIIPLILGFGCVTMALITTRLLGSERERRIAIIILALAVPCSAQMAIVVAVLAGLGISYMMLYILIMFSFAVCAGALFNRLLPGMSSPLMIELPPLRVPVLRNVFSKTWKRTLEFVKEAFPLFAAGTLFLGILEVTGLLQGLRNFLTPITVSWLHLPADMADVFIMGTIRKEFGAVAILSLHMHALQTFVAVATLSLTVPCIASAIIIFKERGWREGLAIWVAVFALAFLVGGILTRMLEAFGPLGILQMPASSAVVMLCAAIFVALTKIPIKKPGAITTIPK